MNLLQWDKAGLICEWTLKHSLRGYFLALNPQFPLYRELRSLLLVLANEFPRGVTSDVVATEREIPKNAVRQSGLVDFILGSRLRTRTLATLEQLGGRAAKHHLVKCVPGESNQSVRTHLKKLVALGLVIKHDEQISFSDEVWTKPLRKLLRGYLRLSPDVKDAIRMAHKSERTRAKGDHRYSLFGRPRMQELLVQLAVRGPTLYTRLLASARARWVDALDIYEAMGVVCVQKSSRNTIVSLNRAHPVYRELLKFLLSLSAETKQSTTDLSVSKETYSVENLFVKPLRTDVLIMVAVCEEISVRDLARMFREYDHASIATALLRYEKLHVLTNRKEGNVLVSTMNEGFTQYRELRNLLVAAASRFPQSQYLALATSIDNRGSAKRRPTAKRQRRKRRRSSVV